jgi:hypothetical protein
MGCVSFKLFCSIKRNDFQAAIDLSSLRVPPDNLYDDFLDSALGAAIGQGSHELIKLLKIVGVSAEDIRIPYIPNVETECCLEALGFFSDHPSQQWPDNPYLRHSSGQKR